MPKFFVDTKDITTTNIVVRDANYNHIVNVFRSGVGDELLLNDRQGKDYKCVIETVQKDFLVATIKDIIQINTEPTTQVVLFQSLIKNDNLELVIQKAVEVGVTKIVPIYTKRCVVKLDGDKKVASKVDRWNKIAEAAAKQSGRGVVPEVCTPMMFADAVAYAKQNITTNIIPYEKQQDSGIKSVLSQIASNKIGVFIGPEGGFEEAEISFATTEGVIPVTLGRRILRSETASIVMVSNIMYEMGEMDV